MKVAASPLRFSLPLEGKVASVASRIGQRRYERPMSRTQKADPRIGVRQSFQPASFGVPIVLIFWGMCKEIVVG